MALAALDTGQAAIPALCAVAAGPIWPDIVSDLLIAFSFLSIPVTLGMIVADRRDVIFRRVIWTFAACIFACAVMLALSPTIFGNARPDIEDSIEIMTAVGVSGTAVTLLFLAHSLRRLPSNSALRQVNHELAGREQDLRQAVRALKDTNRLLVLAEEMAGAGHFRLEADGKGRVWSPGLRRIFGLSDDAALPPGDILSSSYRPADRGRVAAIIADAIATGEPFSFEGGIETPEGVLRTVAARGICEHDESGSVSALFGVCLDLSDRHATEQRLRASEQFLDRAGRIAGVGAWEFDPRSMAIQWSHVTRTIHEVGADYVPTLDAALAFYDPAARRVLSDTLDTALREGKPWDLELPLTTAKGRRLWVRAAGEVEFKDGAASRVFGVFQDVTERRKRELEREGVRLALEEARVEAEAARHKAEEASQAKTTFLASMSHEIRTPLNGIVGFTELLLDSPHLAVDDRRKIEQVQAASNALMLIVNDILDFSKIEAGKIELLRDAVNLPLLLDEVTSITASAAVRKDLTMHLHLHPDVPGMVIGDGNRLRQILTNLLGNAVKFTLFGGIRLVVRPVAAGDGHADLRFEVHDTGIGIAAASQERLFTRFSQLAEGRKKPGSTGLGLAICKSLVEMMGGSIGVESQDGAGACFWFEVPLPPIKDPEPEERRAEPPSSTRPARILVVDDIPMNQSLARVSLEALGHSADVAADGAEAVARVRIGDYDIILMDLQMPEMDGVAATRCIRALGGRAGDIPIFAVTANVLPQQIKECLDAGMDGHVCKPFRRDELAALIFKVTSC